MTRGEANNYYPHLMAQALAVSGDSTGATTLSFIEGALCSTHCPVFAIIKYNGGDLTGCLIAITSGIYDIKSSIGLSDLSSSYTNRMIPLDEKVVNGQAGGVMTVDVSVAASNPPGALFDVYIYGVEFKST